MNYICWVCGKEIGRAQWDSEITVIARIGELGVSTALKAHEECWRKWTAEYTRPYAVPSSLDVCADCLTQIEPARASYAVHWMTSLGSTMTQIFVIEEIAVHDRCWPHWHDEHILPFETTRSVTFAVGLRTFSRELAPYNEVRKKLSMQAIEKLERNGFDASFVAYCRTKAALIYVP